MQNSAFLSMHAGILHNFFKFNSDLSVYLLLLFYGQLKCIEFIHCCVKVEIKPD